MKIKYDFISKKDYNEITKLIHHTWYDDYIKWDNSTQLLYSKIYLYSLLKDSNIGFKATVDNQFAGFILGSINRPNIFRRIKYSILFHCNLFKFRFHKNSYIGINETKETIQGNKKLLKPYKKELKSELTLFIVNSNFRNKGIGTTLMNKYMDVLKKKNIKKFYLYSDTYSNYKFYEKLGFIKLNVMHLDLNDGENAEFYIYEKDI